MSGVAVDVQTCWLINCGLLTCQLIDGENRDILVLGHNACLFTHNITSMIRLYIFQAASWFTFLNQIPVTYFELNEQDTKLEYYEILLISLSVRENSMKVQLKKLWSKYISYQFDVQSILECDL